MIQIKLEILKISDNNFSPQTLSFISHLINLKQLFLGNYIKDPMSVKLEQRIKNGTYNRFFGSLKLLRNMKNLQILNMYLKEVLPKYIQLHGQMDQLKSGVNSLMIGKGINR